MEAIGEDGAYDLDSGRQAEEVADAGYTYFVEGDVVRARVTPCFENQKGALLSKLIGQQGFGTTELFVFVPSAQVDARFLYYVTISKDFTDRGAATMYGAHGVRRVEERFVRDYRAWLPSLDIQRSIAGYLDHKVSLIDALIAAKRRMTKLLIRRFRAALALKVMGRDDPKVSLSLIADCLPGYAFPSDAMKTDTEDAARLLRGTNVGVGRITWDESVYYPRSDEHRFSRYKLAVGDIVIGMDRPVIQEGLRVAQVTETDLPAFLVQRVARIRAQKLTENAYLKFVLSSDSFIDHISPSMTGVSVPHISEEQIMSFRFPLPPARVQQEITRELEHLELRTHRVSQALNRQIALLKERRQALITAAVMGQLDIPEAA